MTESQSFERAKELFYNQSSSWFEEYARKHVRTYVSIWTDVRTSIAYSSVFFTLEDGYARLKTTFATRTDLVTSTYPYTEQDWPTYTGVYPNYPKCLRAQHSSQEASIRSVNCGGCTIHGGEVQLNYWPVNTPSIQPNFTITPRALDLATAVVNGVTFTSPTVYLSIERAYAMDKCSNIIGKEYPGAILSLNPEALSTLEGYEEHTVRPMNYAELYEDVPASRWFQLEGCQPYGPRVTQDCLPIRPGRWPTLVVPEVIRDLDPDWKSCNLSLEGLYDPPRILVPAHALASPTETVSSAFTAPPAIAAPPLHPQEPAKTARPKPVAHGPVRDPPVKDPNPAKNQPAAEPPGKISPTKTLVAGELPAPEQPAHAHAFPQPDNRPTGSIVVAQFQFIRHSAVVTLGPHIYTVDSETHFVIGSKTLSAGGVAATILGETVSLGAKGVMVGSELHAFSSLISPASPVSAGTLKANLYNVDDKHVVIVGSATLSTGETATIGGEVLSVGTYGVVFGGKTRLFEAFQPLATSSKKQGSKNHDFVSGQPSEQSGGESSPLIMNGKTLSSAGSYWITLPPNIQLPSIVTESPTLTVDSAGRRIVGSPTITPGDFKSALARIKSLAPTAFAVSTAKRIALPAITVGSKTFWADSEGRYVINGQTLTTGGSITMSGTVISAPFVSTPTAALPTITIGSRTYTANPAGQFIVAGKTLTLGGEITISGTPISLDPSASALVIGGSTVVLASPLTSSTPNIGSLIMQGFAPCSTPSSNYTGPAYLGSAGRTRGMTSWCAIGLLLIWLMNEGT